jgi:AcrR family transcriptional regulator
MKTYVRRKQTPTRRRDPEQKCALLLSAARELFAAQGYEDTPTAQIAERAGVSEGALFHQFKSKRDLFIRLAEDYGRELAAAVMPEGPTEMASAAIVQAAFSFGEQDPELYRFFSTLGPKVNADGDTPMSKVIVAAIRRLQMAIEQGLLPDFDPSIQAELQFAVVDAAYRAWCKAGRPNDRERYIAEAVRCMDGIDK